MPETDSVSVKKKKHEYAADLSKKPKYSLINRKLQSVMEIT